MINIFFSLISYLYLKAKGVETNFGYVTLYGFPIIHKHPGSRIILGRGVRLISSSRYNYAGINHPAILATYSSSARIEMKENSGASGCSIVSVKNVEIGEDTLIGANTNIYDTDFHHLDPIKRRNQIGVQDVPSSAVKIGKNVWLGGNCTVLKGVTIGDNSVLAANSVVTKKVGSNQLWAGVPAKLIKKIK